MTTKNLPFHAVAGHSQEWDFLDHQKTPYWLAKYQNSKIWLQKREKSSAPSQNSLFVKNQY